MTKRGTGPDTNAWRERSWSLCAAAAALAFYLWQTPSVSGDKDGTEFTLVLAFAGAAHPTGYPLYTLAGSLVAHLLHLLGASWAFGANAFSALGGAFAVYFFHRLSAALLAPALARRASLAAFGPTVLFSLNPIWTYETTLAEVYAWHVAWALGCTLAFLPLLRTGGAEGAGLTSRRALGLGLVVGAGLAHHATSVLVALPLAGAVLAFPALRRGLTLRAARSMIAGVAIPSLSYAFLAWRAFHPAAWQWPALAPSWAGLADHVGGTAYRHFLGSFAPAPVQADLLLRYVYPFVLPALALLGLGALRARGGDRPVAVGLCAVALAGLAYAFSYGVPDPSSYFLAPMAIALAAAPAALSWVVPRRHAGAALLGASLLAGGVAVALAPSWIGVGSDRRTVMERFDAEVRAMWRSIPVEEGYVLWANDMYVRLPAYQLLDGEKPRLAVVDPVFLPHPVVRARFQERHGFDGAAYVTEGLDASACTQAVARAIGERSDLPVILFDPEHRSVRMLRNPRVTRAR